jgi:hypothetical protein
LDKTRRLIIKEAICTHDAETSIISLSASNTFLARYLFNDCSNGIVELFKGEQLDHIQDKFYELSFPNVCNLVASFKHRSRGGYIDNILKL